MTVSVKGHWKRYVTMAVSDILQDIFTRRGSSMKKTGNTLPALADNTSLSSLTVNTGVFERSLTIEEEKSMAKVRR